MELGRAAIKLGRCWTDRTAAALDRGAWASLLGTGWLLAGPHWATIWTGSLDAGWAARPARVYSTRKITVDPIREKKRKIGGMRGVVRAAAVTGHGDSRLPRGSAVRWRGFVRRGTLGSVRMTEGPRRGVGSCDSIRGPNRGRQTIFRS
ncbi:hypothetical protein CRG98_039059 [Punica granatum]|uniref:Uncharacterized protein n=1 Tax=Punica granatum TaxID=22663 RepID=A0A2I0I958_PUNGR|nr:hypothetical protein CRG98_039059 [Punica granatum]